MIDNMVSKVKMEINETLYTDKPIINGQKELSDSDSDEPLV